MGFISLKTKITALTVFLSTVTTGLLGSYLVWNSYQSLRQQAQQSQLALAKALAWQVNEGLSRAFDAVEVLSKRPETIRLQIKPLVREMTLVSTATELIDSLVLFSPNGLILAKSLSTLESSKFPPPSFLKENIARANELKSSVLVDIYKTRSNNLGVAISAPVFRGEDLKGVLVGILYLPNHTIGSLETARIGKSGYAYLVNQQGIAIMHPDRARLLKNLSDNPAVAALQKQDEGVLEFKNPDGLEILAAFAKVKTSSWGVVVRRPTRECYEPAARMMRFMSLFLIITMVVSFFLALILSKRLVKPILELTGQVRRYDEGEIDPEQFDSVKPTDEVGILRHSIGRMTSTIKMQAREREKAYARTLRAERKLAESEHLATVGQFSAGLAHEMNNPLAVILGSARMAQKARGRKLREWLGSIHEEAERCRRLVSELLDFSKPYRLKIRRVDLALLAKETWNQIPGDKNNFHLKVMPVVFKAPADPDKLRQVFTNLLRNSMEAMPKGGKIRVGFRREKEWIRATVTDEGKGILPRDFPKIFRPFFTTKPAGTGLGLPLCRAILQAHGGKMTVIPNQPRGVKITLHWPNT